MYRADILDIIQKSEFVSAHSINLTNCDKEPIHQLGGIQPHGCLIAYNKSGKILQVSSNLTVLIGVDAQSTLQKNLIDVFGFKTTQEIRKQEKAEVYQKYFSITVRVGEERKKLNAVLHLNDGFWVLELEPKVKDESELSLADFSYHLQKIQATSSIEDLYKLGANTIKQLLGFDRVMLYKFAEDHSGIVIAEAAENHLEPYLGLHYPATDIPVQARLLYLHSDIRCIANISVQPAEVLPQINPLTKAPLNQANSVLRSVSPIHVQYLQNMGVNASLSISVVVEGKLWGLFACHHYSEKIVSFPNRNVASLYAKNFASTLQDRLAAQNQQYLAKMQRVQLDMFERFNYEDNFITSLHEQRPTIKELIDCSGCAIISEGDFVALGTTPTREDCLKLVSWIQHEQTAHDVFATYQLPNLYKPAEAFAGVASGVLAIAISKVQGDYILWFRPEKIESVTWAGRQEKEIGLGKDGQVELTPRKSFEAWTESVRYQAEKWLDSEIKVVREMRGVLVDVVMRIAGELKLRADILSRVNRELEASNSELDSFAYIASHDLKEPLRGISNYSQFLLEDYYDVIDNDGKQKLETLIRLSRRMSELLNSLLQYSRVGRVELNTEKVNLNELLEELVEDFKPSLGQNESIILENTLPGLQLDPIRISEVFQNLLANGLKYNEAANKEVKIGLAESSEAGLVDIYVKDNGIGIPENNHEAVFTIFRRLHSREAYGGGSGVGLTIVRKVIERHNGKIRIESELGKGSTFIISLPAL